MSTPRSFEGRSLICPIEAITMKSLPRYLLIVFALAGDSTMTKFFVIAYQVQSRTDECSMTGGCFQTNCLRFSGGGLENSTNRASKAKPLKFAGRHDPIRATSEVLYFPGYISYSGAAMKQFQFVVNLPPDDVMRRLAASIDQPNVSLIN